MTRLGPLLLLALAACAAPPPPGGPTNARGYRLAPVEGSDRALLEIPAGEFDCDGQRVFLPTFWIDVAPGPAVPGLRPATAPELAKALSGRYGLAPAGGTRWVREIPARDEPRVAWRRSFWDAVDEARRRNCILFVTLHWDGCGNCDRFMSKITREPRFVSHVNTRVVPVLGVQHHPGMAPHASLPDGRCPFHPPLRCEEHRACFDAALDAMEWFPMSPGHAILTPHVEPTAGADAFVLVGDDRLPDEGTVESWLDAFEACQARLGPAVTWDAYEAQRRTFAGADRKRLALLAADPKGCFAADATRALTPESDPAAVGAAEAKVREHRWGEALEALGAATGPRADACRTGIARAAWHYLAQARMATRSDRADAAAGWYRRVQIEFPDTDACRVAERETP